MVVIYGSDLGKRVAVSGAPFDIGRSSRCDLSLDQEAVSRVHARIQYDAKRGFVIRDQGSTNGTFVNGERVQEAVLGDDDKLTIGTAILKFMAGDDVETHYHEEIYRVMTVDALTGAHNRRYFNEALEREHNRARRYGRPLSLVLFDVDHWNQLVATHGPVMADGFLQQLGTLLGTKLRREDVLARVGREAFAVLLPEVGLPGARVTGEKIRRLVEGYSFRAGPLVVPCTVSLGVATMAEGAPPLALFKTADMALYRAKQAGRNRVES